MNNIYPKKFFLRPFLLSDKSLNFTYGGRNAIYQFFMTNKIDKILVPSYNCGEEIQPLLSLGIKISPYRIREDLATDLDFLRKEISNFNPDFVLVTHYFGFRNKSFNEILSLCKEKKVFILEDCAHCLPNEIGFEGDVSIYSIRKFLPKSNLGALRINNNNFKKPIKSIPLFFSNKFHKKRYNTFGSKISNNKGYNFQASKIDKIFYLIADLDKISNLRKQNFNYIEGKLLLSNDFFNKPKNTPFVFPVLKKDFKIRNKNYNLKPLQFWTNFHPAIEWNKFPEAVYLKKNLRVLTVNQDINFFREEL